MACVARVWREGAHVRLSASASSCAAVTRCAIRRDRSSSSSRAEWPPASAHRGEDRHYAWRRSPPADSHSEMVLRRHRPATTRAAQEAEQLRQRRTTWRSEMRRCACKWSRRRRRGRRRRSRGRRRQDSGRECRRHGQRAARHGRHPTLQDGPGVVVIGTRSEGNVSLVDAVSKTDEPVKAGE